MNAETPDDADLTCPACATAMDRFPVGASEVHRCPDGHGVFLRRRDVGSLAESETDWHRHAGQPTMPMPRITDEMTAPPVSKPVAQAWVETLFD